MYFCEILTQVKCKRQLNTEVNTNSSTNGTEKCLLLPKRHKALSLWTDYEFNFGYMSVLFFLYRKSR